MLMSNKFSYTFCSQYCMGETTFSFFLEAKRYLCYLYITAKRYVYFFRNFIKILFVAIFAIYIEEINSKKCSFQLKNSYLKICKILIAIYPSRSNIVRQIHIVYMYIPWSLTCRSDRPHRPASGHRRGTFSLPAYFSNQTLPARPPVHSTAAGMLIKSRPRERYVYVSIRQIYWAVSRKLQWTLSREREKERVDLAIYTDLRDFHRRRFTPIVGFLSSL